MDKFFTGLAKTLGLKIVEEKNGYTIYRGSESLLITTEFSDVEEFLDDYEG